MDTHPNMAPPTVSAPAAPAARTTSSGAAATTAQSATGGMKLPRENHHKENHQIALDILDDLSSRFIITVPVEERSDFIRICFQIELAHWFYLDFYCAADNTTLVPCGIKQFAHHIFNHIPFLKEHRHQLADITNAFKAYKMAVPTYGAILMTGDRRRVLLVQSSLARSSWHFPKGAVHADEEPLHCAIREVREASGVDIAALIRPDDFIEGVLNYQYARLYVVPDVPADAAFAPRTRTATRACAWFQLDLLPTHKMDAACREQLGINANSFFMIMPFVKRLKRWLVDRRNNGRSSKTAIGSGIGGNGDGQQLQQRRQRHKSLGDLDGLQLTKGGNPNGGRQVQQQQQQQTGSQTKQRQGCAASAANAASAATAERAEATAQSDAKSASFQRQLFTLQMQQQQHVVPAGAVASVPIAHPPPSQQLHPISDPLALAQRVSGPAVAGEQPPNGNATTAAVKKRRPIEAFLDDLNGDPAVQKWRQFSFVVRPDMLTC